jgi:hypothetical protein
MHGGGHKGLPSISPDGGPTVCLAELHHLHFDAITHQALKDALVVAVFF